MTGNRFQPDFKNGNNNKKQKQTKSQQQQKNPSQFITGMY